MITEHNELQKKNLFSKRFTTSQIEFSKFMMELKKLCDDNLFIVANIITVTYGIQQTPEGQMMDIEVLIEIQNMNSDVNMPGDFNIKEEISIINAINMHYEGNQQESVSALNEINRYLSDNKLQAITPAYTVSHNPFVQLGNNINMDVYVGINPNVM